MLSQTPPVASRPLGVRPGSGALLCLGIVVILISGCAAATASKRARAAEQQQDYDRAIVEYTKALRLHPDDTNARVGLERAKLRAAELHFGRARRLAATGKFDEALVEYELASELNPTSG